jgi:hypothetical protein
MSMSETISPAHASSDAFWTGYLSAAIAFYLRGSFSERDLRETLRAFLRSPLVTPELRAVLTKR